MTIPLVQILGPGLRCIDRACATFTAPKICETSRVLWVHVCGVSFSNGCLTVICSTEQATNPGILWWSKSNTVKLQHWVYCCSNLQSTLRVTTELWRSKSATLFCLCNHTFCVIYCMELQHTTMQLGQVWEPKCNMFFIKLPCCHDTQHNMHKVFLQSWFYLLIDFLHMLDYHVFKVQ